MSAFSGWPIGSDLARHIGQRCRYGRNDELNVEFQGPWTRQKVTTTALVVIPAARGGDLWRLSPRRHRVPPCPGLPRCGPLGPVSRLL
jgi:hypothetical protein